MTPWTELFAPVVIGLLLFAVLIAVIVALAVPVTERHERRQAMRAGRHPAGRHTERYVHGGQR